MAWPGSAHPKKQLYMLHMLHKIQLRARSSLKLCIPALCMLLR
eukprot:SAG22_NODE_23200_length_164_cov_27.523077_1_plen_42_part_01